MPFAAAVFPTCSEPRPVICRSDGSGASIVTSAPSTSSLSFVLRRADPHRALGRAAYELLDTHVGEQPDTPDHDQVVGRLRHLMTIPGLTVNVRSCTATVEP